MNIKRSLFYRGSMVLFTVVLILIFGIAPALAFPGKGDIRVNIDNQFGTPITGAYFHFKCDGASVVTVKDGGTGDSNATAGIVDISSISAGFSGSGCNSAESFTVASISFPGYIHTTTQTNASYSVTALNSAAASLSFALKVTAVTNELTTDLPLTSGTIASASVAGHATTYNGTSAYIPASVSAGTFILTAGGNGYINETLTTITLSSKSQQTAHFDTVADAGANDWVGTPLPYGLKVSAVTNELTNNLSLASGTVASASVATYTTAYSGTSAYIPVPISAGSFTLTTGADGYVNKTLTTITLSKTTQQTAHFDTVADAGANDWVGLPLSYGLKATVQGYPHDGDLVSMSGASVKAGDSSLVSCTDNNNGDYYCAIPLAETGTTASAVAFAYGVDTMRAASCTYTDRTAGGDAQSTCTMTSRAIITTGGSGNSSGGGYYITQATPTPTPTPSVSVTPSPVYSPLVTSTGVKLFRKVSDPKVYVQGSDGTLTWVKTLQEFNAAGYSWTDVKLISGSEFGKMRVGGNVRVVKGIAFLRVRDGSSTAGKIVGKVLPGQELKFSEIKNGWYKIDSGWVSGAYAKEF